MGTPIGINKNGSPTPISAPVNEPSAPVQTKEPVKDKTTEQPVAEKPRSEAEVTARKAEKQFEGTARYQELNSQIQSVGSNTSAASLSKAKDIASDNKMTLDAKRTALQKQMESANTEEFKTLVNGSKDWPDKEQKVFSNAMGESEKIMKRVGTELKPEDQVNAVIRADKYGTMAGTGKQNIESYNKITKNVDQWMLNTDGKVIDEAFSKNKEFKDRFTSHASFPGLPDMPGMSSKAKEKMVDSLTGENKQNFILDTTSPNVDYQRMGAVSPLHNKIMKGMTPAEKNATIDKLQDSGQLSDFVKHVDSLDARTVVQGLTPQNAGVVAAEYHKLAQKSPGAFDRLSSQVDGYAENNFKKNDYEEYIRMRNSYHR